MPFTPDSATAPKSGFVPDSKSGFVPDQAPAKYESPGVEQGGGIANVLARIKDPNRLKAILGMGGPAAPEVVAGTPPSVTPSTAMPGAMSKLAAFLGSNPVTRTAAGTALGAASGALSNPSDRAAGAQMGAFTGGGMALGGEALGGAAKGLKWGGRMLSRMTAPQSEAFLSNPAETKVIAGALEDQSKMPALQDKAAQAIANSRKALKTQGLQDASKVSAALEGKRVPINPEEIAAAAKGSSIESEVNKLLEPYKSSISPSNTTQLASEGIETSVPKASLATSQPPVEGMSNAVSAPGNEVNALKRYLQEGARFQPGTVTDPVQAAKSAALGSQSHGLRTAIEGVSPEVAPLNQRMQESVLLQKALRQGQKNPLAFASSQSPDRIAAMARAENRGAGGILDFGNQLGAAKTMTSPDVGSGVPTFLSKLGGRTLMRAVNPLTEAPTEATPIAIQKLLSLFGNQEQ